MNESNVFEIKSYTMKELACLYHPGVTTDTATRRLRYWITIHPSLSNELKKAGWREGSRLLTPLQVKLIVYHLGDP